MADKPDDSGENDSSKIQYLFGPDGLPTGGPSNAVYAHAAETRFKRDFAAALARWQVGDLTAFSTMLWLVSLRSPEAFPRVLLTAGDELVQRAMAEVEKSARQDFKMHWTRWEMVTELCERKDELSHRSQLELEQAKAVLMAASRSQNIEERNRVLRILPELKELARDNPGSSLTRAHAAVSEALAGDPKLAGSARAIRESYDIIEGAGGAAATFESFLKERERREELRRRRRQPEE